MQRQQNAAYETSESRVPLNVHSGVLTTQFCSSLRVHWNAPDSPFVHATPEQQEAVLRYYRTMGQLSTYLMHLVRANLPPLRCCTDLPDRLRQIARHCCPERNVAQFASYADILPPSGGTALSRLCCVAYAAISI